MAEELVFPDNPYEGQIYSQNGRSWKWNGTYWESYNPPVTDKNVVVVVGEYLIGINDGNRVLLSSETTEGSAYIWLTTEADAEIRPGFRFEMWRVTETIGFEAEQGITVFSPDGNWVSKPGGRAVVMKVADQKWIIHGDMVPSPGIEYIKTESDDYISTDN